MAPTQTRSRSLPHKPSAEHLRKQAKDLARSEGIQLAAAQRRLAREYGYNNWSELMAAVATMSAQGNDSATPSQSSSSPLVPEPGPNVLPLLPLRELVTFPQVSYPMLVERATSIGAVQHAADRKTSIVLVAQKDPRKADPSASDMYQVGVVASVVQVQQLPDGTIKAIFEGTARGQISRFLFDEDFIKAEVGGIEERVVIPNGRIKTLVVWVIEALLRKLGKKILERAIPGSGGWGLVLAKTYGAKNPIVRADLGEVADMLAAIDTSAAIKAGNVSTVADRIASELPLDLAFKQELLELFNPAERLEKLLAYLSPRLFEQWTKQEV